MQFSFNKFFRLDKKLILSKFSDLFLTIVTTENPAIAATATGNLTVNANVVANCQVTNLTINLGNYDPLVSNALTPLDQQGALSIKCTKGVQATSIDLNAGSNSSGTTRRMKITSGTDLLQYELYKNSGRSSIWGSGSVSGVVPDVSTSYTTDLKAGSQPINIYGRVPAGQDISIGSYTDTVTITINY